MNKKAAALFTVILSTTLIVLLSVTLLVYMTSEIMLVDHQINRAKAFYAAEGAIVEFSEKLRQNQTLPPLATVDWYYISGKPSSGKAVTINYDSTNTTGPYGSNPLEIIINDYRE